MSDPVHTPVRLAKQVSELARCSRIEAEQYIKGGWVSVDGRVVEDPAHPISTETVALDPAALLETVEPATILLHKPVGYDTISGRKAAAGLVKAAVSTRGVICQDRPHLSLHQPHSLSCPPLPTMAFQ